MTDNKAYLQIIADKIKMESDLSEKRFLELMSWLEEQSIEMLEFLASDEFQYNEVHLHTEKSLLDGVGSVKDYLKQARKLRHRALAVTDHGVTHNWFALRSVANAEKDDDGNVVAEGLRPIFGCEIYLNFKDKVHHFLLLAENTTGYQNILHIVTEGHLNKSNTSSAKPNVGIEVLEKYNEGIIATTACIGGVVGKHIQNGSDWETIVADTEYFANLFKGRFYLEIQDYEVENEDELEDFQLEFIEKQRRVNDGVIHLAEQLKLPLVATNDCHYPKKGDHMIQEILLCVRTKDKLDNPDRFRFQSNLHYMKDKWEMLWRFRNAPQAVFNTWEIAKRCEVSYQNDYLLPTYPYLPEDMTAVEFFKESVRKGCIEFYSKDENFQPLLEKFECTPEELWEKIHARAEFEVNVLVTMGFEGYMQIVSWINELALKNNILIGPGRGSAAGSIVALALNITLVCPLRYDLLFERFLNPDRIEMPDIDADYQYERRGELIGLVQQELGHDKVAQIVTFGKMKARAALRDVGRVLGTPAFLVDKMAKQIPFGKGIKDALELVPEFKQEYDKNPEAKRLVDYALLIEGKPKNYSVHAAGIILSRESIPNHASFQSGKKAILPVIQAEMNDVDGLRLVKQDFLGLRTLSVEAMAIKLIELRHGIKIDPYKIPKDDKKTYELLASGESIACFQLESQGMRQLLKDMQVERLEDIVDCIALYRPGVLSVGMHNEYVKNKFNPDSIKYIHPSMKTVLAPTRGIMIYQEQAMLLANQLAGFSMAEADKLRKAIGKKKADLMAKLKVQFVKGCYEVTNIPNETAEEIWHLIEVMASYSFNKSHSVAYAFISVDTAYLKANYPIEYMCAAIALAAQAKSPKVPLYIEEAKRMGIKVVAPDINLSEVDFDIKNDNIIFGLRAIRDVGKGAAEIVAERNANGPFKSIIDFRKRVKVNKKVVAALIKAGCFDSLGVNRYALGEKLEEIVAIKPEASKKKKNTKQLSLLPDFDELEQEQMTFSDIAGPTKDEIADIESEMCGIYITHHPLATHKDALYDIVSVTGEELLTRPEGSLVVMGGLIKEKKVVYTKKNNEEMAIYAIDDLTDHFNLVAFPRQYAKFKELNEKSIVLLKGRVQYKEKFNSSKDNEEDDSQDQENEVEYEIQIVIDEMVPFDPNVSYKHLALPDQPDMVYNAPQKNVDNNQPNPSEELPEEVVQFNPKEPVSLSEFLKQNGNPLLKII